MAHRPLHPSASHPATLHLTALRQTAPWRIRATTGLTAWVLSLGLVVAGCGQPGAASAAAGPGRAPARSHQPLPGGRASSPARSRTGPAASPVTAPGGTTAPPRPVFRASASVLTAAMRARMTGRSWHRGCPVGLDRLRLLRLSYWGFDHAVHQGKLVVNESAAASLTRVFRLLFAARFPIRQMRPVDAFGGHDELSMRADNTSAFNCRLAAGSASWSEHAYGLAVDVNPFENPMVFQGGAVDPAPAAGWADRTRPSPAIIRHGDAAWKAFHAVGWGWGGDWTDFKDYQHFSVNGR